VIAKAVTAAATGDGPASGRGVSTGPAVASMSAALAPQLSSAHGMALGSSVFLPLTPTPKVILVRPSLGSIANAIVFITSHALMP
jgi:hypothetical protein